MSSELVRDRATILADLAPTSTVPERIEALRDIGLPHKLIAYGIGVGPNAVHNWKNEKAEPRTKSVRRLDNIRHAAYLLISEAGLEPEAATTLLARKKEIDNSPIYPILDAIRENPTRVFGKIDAFAKRYREPELL
jgi:hypothetical protein